MQCGDDVATSGHEINRPKNAADNTDAAGRAQNRTSRLLRGDSRRTKRAPIFVALARTRFPLVLMLLWIRGGFGHAQTLHDFLRKFNYQLQEWQRKPRSRLHRQTLPGLTPITSGMPVVVQFRKNLPRRHGDTEEWKRAEGQGSGS